MIFSRGRYFAPRNAFGYTEQMKKASAGKTLPRLFISVKNFYRMHILF